MPVFEIVKVQRPIETNAPQEECLVYNRDRTVMFSVPLSDQLRSLFGDRFKIFVQIAMFGAESRIIREVEAQPW